MKEGQIYGWLFLAFATLLLGVSEVRHGHELAALRAGQAEVAAGIAAVGQEIEDLGRRIDNLAEALGQPIVEQGLSSWYGDESGKVTANGERFNRLDLTAAHKKAAFGTRCVVVNLKNGRRILVRINDRGPFIKGRILDVTERSAGDLEMLYAGVVPIRIYLITNAIPIARPGTGD